MNIDVSLLNAFTAENTGGNPAGVVLNAGSLTKDQKQMIATQVGFSETAFVTDDHLADFNVSFFTPTDEVDFCGHATIAVFSELYRKGLISCAQYTQQTKAGMLAVDIQENGHVIMEQALPKTLAQFSHDEIAPLLGVPIAALEATQLPITAMSTGLPDLIVPVSAGYLDNIRPNFEAITLFCQAHKLVGLHVFELSSEGVEVTASCRNFAPLYGIPEESATGSSCGALACYLAQVTDLEGQAEYLFEQGRLMGCRSLISASVERKNRQMTRVRIGGFANTFGSKTLSLP